MSILVRRDQFNITPQGIVHKPTDAAFTPHPGDPFTGITRLGRLGNQTTDGYRAEDVQRVMWQFWIEYVTGNPQLSKTAYPVCVDPGEAGFDWPQPANSNDR